MKRKIFSILFALVLVLSFSLVTAVPAAAEVTTWYVATDGSDAFGDGTETWVDTDTSGDWNSGDTGPWLTITYAIDAAGPGDTITVAAGTYNEKPTIDQALTLKGAQFGVDPALGTRTNPANESIIDVGGGFEGIEITASNVTVDGFTMQNSRYFVMRTDTSETQNNVVLRNNIFEARVQLYSINNLEFSHNQLPGSPEVWRCSGTVSNNTMTNVLMGISLKFCDGLTVQDNTLTARVGENTDDGIDVQGGSNITIKGNTITGFTAGEREGYNNGTDGAGISIMGGATNCTVEQNTLVNNSLGVLVEGATEGSEIHINHNNLEDNTIFGVLNCGVWTGETKTYTPASVTIDATFNWWGYASGPSGEGLGSGDAVSENVDFFPWALDEDCTEIANSDTTVVVVDDDWTGSLDFTQFMVDDTDYYIGVNAFAIIQEAIDAVAADGTVNVAVGTYDPFTVVGKTGGLTIQSDGAVTVQGSQSVATNYTDRDCVVFVEDSTNIVLDGLDIEGSGLIGKNYGVIYENSSGEINGCTVSPNTVGDMTSMAIGIWDGSEVIVDTCILENFGRVGMLIYSGCTVEVLDSTIIGQVYTEVDKVCYGIEVEGAYMDDDPSTASQVTIRGNEIYNCDNTYYEAPTWQSGGVYINGWMEYYAAADSTVIVENNDIHDNYSGIIVIKSELSYAHLNNIYDNRAFGVESLAAADTTTAVFDATNNWWGTAIKSQIAEMVSDNVDYSPWLDGPGGGSTNLDVTTIDLAEGWNLMSLPLIPDVSAIETVLDGIDVEKVAYYTGGPKGSWLFYTPGAPSDLYTMSDGKGYWIVMNNAEALTIRGYELCAPPPTVPPSYDLVIGWNLIGFKSLATDTNVATYLGTVTATMEAMYGYDAAAGLYTIIKSTDNLVPGDGYWLAVSADGTIYP